VTCEPELVAQPGTPSGLGIAADQRTAGLVAAAAGAAAWGFTGIFVKLAAVSPLVLSMYRLWLGALLMGLLLAARGRRITWRLLRQSIPAGVLFCLDITLFFAALRYTSVAVASVIGALQPALVLIVAGRWFDERVSRRGMAWTALAVAGVAAVAATGDGHSDLLGDALAVASLLAFTGYWLLSKRVRAEGVGAGEYTSAILLVAAIAVTPVALLSGEKLTPARPTDWLWVGLLSLVPGAGHLLFNWAHRYVEISVSSVIGSGNPVVASVAALIILGQPLTPLQVVGGLVAVIAIAVVARRPSAPPAAA
jgi:drug/metabolite transporter (DMT)-like permease